MSRRPFDWKRDGGGLALFVAGTFVAVLMLKSLASEQPLETLTGTAAIAERFATGLGALPILVLASGVAFLGARAFVTASETGILRHLLGLAGCALGLSILCGAFSDLGGGRIGLVTGGALAQGTHATLGGLAGLAVVFATVWFVWLRELEVAREEIRPGATGEAQEKDTGVSAEEAAGLIPEDLTHALEEGRKSLREKALPSPASPYPEDVRLRGQVPEGARPLQVASHLENRHASPIPEARSASRPASAPAATTAARDAAGAHLAAAPAAGPALDTPAAREVRALPAGVQPIRPLDEELSEPGEDRVALEDARPLADAPERPSWEQTGLGEDDEPVDAYGTPLSIVDSLRKARQQVAEESEDFDAAVEPLAVPDEVDPEPQAELEEVEPIEEEEEETIEVLALQEPELEEAPPALPIEAPQELDDAVMAESEEFADDAELLVEEEAELEELDEEVEEEEVELEDVEEEEEAEDLVEEPAQASEPTLFEDTPAAPLPALPEAEEALEAHAVSQTTIFDFTAGPELFPIRVQEPEPPPEPEPEPELALEATVLEPDEPEAEEAVCAPSEREVVLQPMAVAPERTRKPLAVDPERAKLLSEAGCLFVERGRVAVSMLQRQYGMDFDDACKVLDELQDLGLIGPYLGGQRRDILLTREQWLEKVGST